MGMDVGGKQGGAMATMNVVPLIDILLVLIIIFMVITPLTPKGLDALVPQPAPPNQQQQPQTMQKTIVVELEYRVRHPLYGKIIRTTTKVKAHDENGDAGIGDRVSLMETRPLSATKRWRLVEILERAK